MLAGTIKGISGPPLGDEAVAPIDYGNLPVLMKAVAGSGPAADAHQPNYLCAASMGAAVTVPASTAAAPALSTTTAHRLIDRVALIGTIVAVLRPRSIRTTPLLLAPVVRAEAATCSEPAIAGASIGRAVAARTLCS